MAACPNSTSSSPSEVFRATFLAEIENQETRATVVAFGALFLELVREAPLVVATSPPADPVSVPRSALAASLAELADVAEYLMGTAGRSGDEFELRPEDVGIAEGAAELGASLRHLIRFAGQALV